MKKKLLLYVVFMMTTLCSYAAYYDFTVDGIFYKIKSKTDKTCSVTYEDTNLNSYAGNIIIPEKVTFENVEYTVTCISYLAFSDCPRLKSVILPNTIETIGSSAFSGCVQLVEIHLPEKVKELEYAFKGCVSLEKVYLNNGIEKINRGTFTGCVSLEQISIPSSVTYLAGDAFSGCTSLSMLKFEDGEEPIDFRGMSKDCPLDSIYIGRNILDEYPYAHHFGEISTLRSVYISDAVTKIVGGMFYECTGLTNVYGMKNVEAITAQTSTIAKRDGCFYGCTSLKSFVIGNKVTYIGQYTFSGCTSLETLVIGDGIEILGGSSDATDIIYGCNLKSLYLGKGIKSIGSNALGGAKLAIQKIYMFSDVLSDVYHYVSSNGSYRADGIPITVGAIYVPNTERYETLLGKDYNLQPMLTFNETSLEYTGCTPELSYKNNVDGFNVSFDEETTPKDAGSYSMNVDITFSNADWSATVEIPCSYTITKAPLTVIANNARRYYGEENPELTETIIGFKNGETEEVLVTKPVLSTLATSESDAGTYPIYCSGSDAKNYAITFQHGTLTIDRAPQKIVWDQDFADAEVGDMIELTAACSSGMPVKYRSSDQTSVLIASQGDMQYAYILKPATVAITAYQPGNKNYEEADEISKIVIIQTTSINEVRSDCDGIVSYYSLDGKPLDRPSSGRLVLMKMGDGTVRKVYCK